MDRQVSHHACFLGPPIHFPAFPASMPSVVHGVQRQPTPGIVRSEMHTPSCNPTTEGALGSRRVEAACGSHGPRSGDVSPAGTVAGAAHSGVPSLMLISTISNPVEVSASASSAVTSCPVRSGVRPRNNREHREWMKMGRLRGRLPRPTSPIPEIGVSLARVSDRPVVKALLGRRGGGSGAPPSHGLPPCYPTPRCPSATGKACPAELLRSRACSFAPIRGWT